MLRGEMPEPERRPNWKGRPRVCRRSRRNISVSSLNENGSMRLCWNLRAVLRPMNTNVRDIRDDQDRDQSCGKCRASWTRACSASAIGVERGRRVERRLLRSNSRNSRGNDRSARQGFRNWRLRPFGEIHRRRQATYQPKQRRWRDGLHRQTGLNWNCDFANQSTFTGLKVCFRRREFRECAQETMGFYPTTNARMLKLTQRSREIEMSASLTLNKITAQKGITIAEAASRVADLGWTPSYVQEAMTFPTDYKISKTPRDPMRQVLRSYFPMQEEKDNRVYGALDAALRGDMFRNVEPRWVEWVQLVVALIPSPDSAASCAMAMVGRLAAGEELRTGFTMQMVDEPCWWRIPMTLL